MLENKKCGRYDTHCSRYIISWKHAGGKLFDEEFEDWLKSEGLTEEEIADVREMAMMGKMELELSAAKYVEKEKANFKTEVEEHSKDRVKREFKKLTKDITKMVQENEDTVKAAIEKHFKR